MPLRRRNRIVKKVKPTKKARLVAVKRKKSKVPLKKKQQAKMKRKVVRRRPLVIEESTTDNSSSDQDSSESDITDSSSSEDEKSRRRYYRRKTKRSRPVPKITIWPYSNIAAGLTSARCNGISQASCDADPQCVSTNWGCRDRPGVFNGAQYEGPINRAF